MTEATNWSQLAGTLAARRLLPLLGPHIMEMAGGKVGDDFREALTVALEVGGRRGIYLQLVSARIAAMLAEADIRSSPLKGPFLGKAIYGDPGRRLSNDIDLLVAPDDLRAAVTVVQQLDYGAPTDHVQSDGLRCCTSRWCIQVECYRLSGFTGECIGMSAVSRPTGCCPRLSICPVPGVRGR